MRTGTATTVRRRAWAIVVVAVAVIAAASRASSEDDTAWRARIEKQVKRLEVVAAELDAQAPSGRTLLERVIALDVRVRAMETAAGLESGPVRRENDLSLLSLDVTMLQTRLDAVRAAREPKKQPPPGPTPEKPAPGKPAGPGGPVAPGGPPAPGGAPKPGADPVGGDPKGAPKKSPAASKWPDTVRFLVTAKFVYAETGEWVDVRDDFGVLLRRDFLQDGFRGTLGFSLRAANLRTDVRSVLVRIGVRMKSPFASDESSYRVYDVRWDASNKVFGNESLKTLAAYDVVTQRGPIQWISGPRERSMALEPEAYVISATLPSGEELDFEPPKFGTK